MEVEDIEIAGESRLTDKMPLTIEVMPPDVAIVDIDAAPDSGLSLAQRIKQVTPSTAVIVLASNTSDASFLKQSASGLQPTLARTLARKSCVIL